MARKSVNQMVNEFFHECQDIDLAIFVTYDNEIKTNVIRCLTSNDLKCGEKILTEINHKNITSIFQHLTQHHGAYYDSISRNFHHWYNDQKDRSAARIFPDAIITSEDVKSFLKSTATTTKTKTMNRTQRLAKFAEYQKVWAILITQTTNLMVDFSEEKINENDLKQKN